MISFASQIWLYILQRREEIRLTSENFPISEYYKTEEALTSLGTGEALVTALSEKGTPTPLASVMMRAPMSRMDILSSQEITDINRSSDLVRKYSREIDRESAYEMLEKRISEAEREKQYEEERKREEKERTRESSRSYRPSSGRRSAVNPVVKVLTSATFIRGVMGVLTKAMKK